MKEIFNFHLVTYNLRNIWRKKIFNQSNVLIIHSLNDQSSILQFSLLYFYTILLLNIHLYNPSSNQYLQIELWSLDLILYPYDLSLFLFATIPVNFSEGPFFVRSQAKSSIGDNIVKRFIWERHLLHISLKHLRPCYFFQKKFPL